jgi:hypothetical protein
MCAGPHAGTSCGAPYGAFYRIEADQIIVFCVIDLRQDPATWKARIPNWTSP